MKTRQNTYYDSDVMQIIRNERARRFPEQRLAFSLTINALIREWHFWSEYRHQQERNCGGRVSLPDGALEEKK